MCCGRDGLVMKRWMGRACAVLCALALVLAGCTSTRGRRVQGDVAGATASGATGEHAGELDQALVKTWSLNRTEQDGLTIFDEDDVYVSLILKGDGSAMISQSTGGAVFGSWEASDFDDITFYKEKSYMGGKRYTAYPITYNPDANELYLDAEAWDREGTLCFADGIQFMSQRVTYPSSADLTAIRDASTLVGDWELYWVMEDDAVAEGEADRIAAWIGRKSGVLTLAEGGKGTFLGDEVEWWMDEGFATMTVVGDAGKRESLDIEQLADGIVVSSAEEGAQGFVYLFAKSK